MAKVYTLPSILEQEKELQKGIEALEQQINILKERLKEEVMLEKKRAKAWQYFYNLAMLISILIAVYAFYKAYWGQGKNFLLLGVTPLPLVLLFIRDNFPNPRVLSSVKTLKEFNKLASKLNDDKKYLERIQSGSQGEKECLEVLKGLPDCYHIFSDLKVPYENSVKQVDSIVVGPNGIFVIEAKNHKGYIAGYASLPIWTQYNFYNDSWNAREIVNPVKQNWLNTMALKDYLRFKRGALYWLTPIVVFCGEGTNISAVYYVCYHH